MPAVNHLFQFLLPVLKIEKILYFVYSSNPRMQNENSFSSQITNEPFPPSFETPESYNQMNTLLSYYNLPTIDSNDSIESKIEKLKEICANKYLKIDTAELSNLSNAISSIKEYREIEKQCDNWEIELANMNSEDSRKYGNRSIEELQIHLNNLRKNMALQDKYSEHKHAVEEVLSLADYLSSNIPNIDNSVGKKQFTDIKSESNNSNSSSPFKRIKITSENTLASLGSLKEETFGSYVKQKVLDKLIDRKEEWAIVLCKVVKENKCKVETLKNELGIDRVNLLRIIYNYSSKGILEYDRLNDTVSLVDN